MKIPVTNEALLMLDSEMQSWNGAALYLLLNGKISKFYQDNGIRINSVKQKRLDIIREFLVIEDGKVKTEMVDGKEEPIFIDTLRKKEFQDKMNEFSKAETSMEV